MDPTTSDARTTLAGATQVERRTKAAGRWFAGYLLLMGGLAVALIVAVEVFFPSGLARTGAAVTWALAVATAGWWAESHDVHPERARRRVYLATAAWFGLYLVAVGPFVRWQAGASPVWWSVAAVGMASPFLVGAWREWRRP